MNCFGHPPLPTMIQLPGLRSQRTPGAQAVVLLHAAFRSLRRRIPWLILATLLILHLISRFAWCQWSFPPCVTSGFPALPVCPGTLELAPVNPFGTPGSSIPGLRSANQVYLTQSLFRGILPDIPNLDVGYLYTWVGSTQQGYLTFDYTRPVTVNGGDVLFGEAHGQFEDLIDTLGGAQSPNLQMLFGGGYRKRLPQNVMFGLNGFYNTARIAGAWYSSGIAGLEFAAVSAGESVVMLSATYYGNVFGDASGLFSAYRGDSGDYRVEASYEQPFLDHACLLKLKGGGYRLQRQDNVYGWNVGADLTTRNRMLSVRYETGHDPLNAAYHTLGVFVTVGFRPENVLSGSNPFTWL